ncbi:iron ABC transporter permease [Thermococcus sp. P6]|uniref:FecCD family ABC transporter permease n=1 Tax=Thermococcus sp. P6 TaxID=122420 RepID=UPI000B59F215|nr:iron ABC transporter permease [Thermococcus sp. P6]ASJ11151.1 iron ABC transporter permease [Thermococcus sp. P6]
MKALNRKASGDVGTAYEKHVAKKAFIGIVLSLLIILVGLYSLSHGSYGLSIHGVIDALLGDNNGRASLVIWNIRLPRIIAAVLVGASLAVSGAVLQGILKNPIATPFTMGISHGAMFGASLAILLGAGYAESSGRIVLDNPYVVVLFAFLGAITGTAVIIALAKLKGLSPEAMILAGVAMSSLFAAMTTLLQYLASELQLAAMVYWSFGDLGRATWRENLVMLAVFVPSFLYFLSTAWDLNASTMGDDVARSVGVNVERVRLISAFLAALITSVGVAFVGIIGFIGLLAPHTIRLIAGGDYRFLVPLSALAGAFILLTADTVAKLAFSPVVLPVGVITSFLGAPMFIYLLVRMEGRL